MPIINSIFSRVLKRFCRLVIRTQYSTIEEMQGPRESPPDRILRIKHFIICLLLLLLLLGGIPPTSYGILY